MNGEPKVVSFEKPTTASGKRIISTKSQQAKRPLEQDAKSALRFGKEEGDGVATCSDAFKAMRILLEAWRRRVGVSAARRPRWSVRWKTSSTWSA